MYRKSIEAVLKELRTTESGLNDEEVLIRQRTGLNELETTKKKSQILIFLSQFSDMMIIILIIAAGISFASSIINNESYVDAIIILVVVFLNAILGYVQERKADKTIESLKKLSTPFVRVKRNDEVHKIPAKELVVGDIILLEAGDIVPADARILYANSLQVDESMLTGESLPVYKNTDEISMEKSISEQFNMLFSGCPVTYGKANAVVTSIGMNTELGKIASHIDTEKNTLTPLQLKLMEVSKILTILVIIITVIMLIIGVIRGNTLIDTFLLAISLAVAAIPEGLPAVITITLSLGMKRLADKKAVVRKMSSVETLGSTSVICSDKTGTLTENKMKLIDLVYDNEIRTNDNELNEKVLHILALCNDVEIEENHNYIGDPTEIALVDYLEQKNISVKDLKKTYERVDEVPFDSNRKLMTSVNLIDDKYEVLTKGSLDSLLTRCTHYYEDGKVRKLTVEKRTEILSFEKAEAKKALRVLSFAYKEIKVLNENEKKHLESDLIFMGMVGMMDPPRKEVYESIRLCKESGIKPIMITGDSLNTAIAIGMDIGILDDSKKAIEGADLDKLSESERNQKVLDYQVYARVSPEHKLQIVKALQNHNKIVAMTGDGVNDAAAVKLAHIGISMGITGTEVTKNAADVILMDDSFSTIVTAVQEGRRIYDNIKNAILYLLTANITEVLVVLISVICGWNIFLPIHLLFINLITDSLPAIALAFEQAEPNIMKRGVKENQKLFTPFMFAKLATSSIIKTIILMLLYTYGLQEFGSGIAISMTFMALIIIELLFAFSCKNIKQSVLNKNIFKNKYLNWSVLLLVGITIIVFYTPLRALFSIELLNITQIAVVVTMAFILFLLEEITKPIIAKLFKDE